MKPKIMSVDKRTLDKLIFPFQKILDLLGECGIQTTFSDVYAWILNKGYVEMKELRDKSHRLESCDKDLIMVVEKVYNFDDHNEMEYLLYFTGPGLVYFLKKILADKLFLSDPSYAYRLVMKKNES